MLRELVQNADDAGASIIVLRFEADALYVANDGRAFTTTGPGGKLGDFERISLILKRHQADDKETTGHFGSGFQTVYTLTNSPEVHSGGRSGRMNPVRKEWDYFDVLDESRLVSPYVWKRQNKGVIFKFPWRNNQSANEEYGEGQKPFSEKEDWPRWDEKTMRGTFEDLCVYIHQALLCCKKLRIIRLIWCIGDAKGTYQAERDFDFDKTNEKTWIGAVAEGSGRLSPDWLRWDKKMDWSSAKEWSSFQVDSWVPGHDSKTYQYLIASGSVTDKTDQVLHVGRRPDAEVVITNKEAELTIDLKRNDVHLLLPLFDAQLGPGRGGYAFLYSTIPLPNRGGNYFAFTGHFFPEEGRKDVAVTSLGGVSGDWHRRIVLSVGKLYRDSLSRFLDEVRNLGNISDKEKQRIVLNAVPGIPLYQWMRPGRENEAGWADSVFGDIMEDLISLPILWNGKEWSKPVEAYWPRKGDGVDAIGLGILNLMGSSAFTADFVSHPHFRNTLKVPLEQRHLSQDVFLRLFAEFLRMHAIAGKGLCYGQKLAKGAVLGHDETMALIEFCVTGETTWRSARELPVVPGVDLVFRPVSAYPIVPDDFADLKRLLPPSMQVHTDFQPVLKDVDVNIRKMRPDDVVAAVAKIAQGSLARFERLNDADHKSTSRILAALAQHDDFTLKAAYMDLTFIPHCYEGVFRLGPPNAHIAPGSKSKQLFSSPRAEQYERDFIFSPPKGKIAGLSPGVQEKIRFLDLAGVPEDAIERVVDKLYLKGIQEGPVPTDFVRHFLSDRHGSLFRDEILMEFLGTRNSSLLDNEKRNFFGAILDYYRPDRLEKVEDKPIKGRTEKWLNPDDMGKVPCLYDGDGEWHEARDFAIEMRDELEMLNYKALHPDFQKWPPETLLALGVVQRPQSERVIEVVQKLAKDPRKNRQALADVVVFIAVSDEPWADTLRELEDLVWVTTKGDGFSKPRDVLVPYPKNQAIVGKDCPFLFDLDACSKESKARATDRMRGNAFVVKPERLKELGLVAEPTMKMMLTTVERLVKNGSAPPPELLNSLNEMTRNDVQRLHETGYYYHNGKWWRGTEIFFKEDKELAEAMGESYLFLSMPDVASHWNYLNYIGSREAPETLELLGRIAEFSSLSEKGQSDSESALLRLWDCLEGQEIERTAVEAFANRVVYPVNRQRIPFKQLILSDEQGPNRLFCAEGSYGEFYMVGSETCSHIRTLKSLDVKTASQLTPSDVCNILKSISKSKVDIDMSLAETCVRLLVRLCNLDRDTDLAGATVWPIVKAGKFSLGRPGNCYIRDHPVARLFEQELPFLFEESEGIACEEVRSLALRQREKPSELSKVMRERLPEPSKPREDVYGTRRLRLLAVALDAAFPDTHRKLPDSIAWLQKVQMFKVDSLQMTLKVASITKDVNLRCMIRRKADDSTVFRLDADPRLCDDLASDIAEECRRRGFPGRTGSSVSTQEAPAVLRQDVAPLGIDDVIYRALTRSPTEWHLFINNLQPLDEWLPPLTDIDVEAKPGYPQTRRKLNEMYGYCQICGKRTPADEFTGDTCEQVRSIVSMRGGRYMGEFNEYTTSNSLFLCPRHHTLYERKLVKLKVLEDGEIPPLERAMKLRRMADEWGESGIPIEVFEGEGRDAEGVEAHWTGQTLNLDASHAREILQRLADWVEENKHE